MPSTTLAPPVKHNAIDATLELSGPKATVRDYWNREACDTVVATAPKFSREYFEEIEAYRYGKDPHVLSFAQFTRYHGKRVLEIGVGAGTDFLQWVRAGAKAHGVDLTEEAVRHVEERLKVYGLRAEDIRVADAERLPYPDEAFDLVYSWGVLHHTTDPVAAIREAVRVLRKGGVGKLMLYNRHSYYTFYRYLQYGLLRGLPFRSVRRILATHQESPGTVAFTKKEVSSVLQRMGVRPVLIEAPPTRRDLLSNQNVLLRAMARTLTSLFGRDHGWYMLIEFQK